jgi:hypothetical protein
MRVARYVCPWVPECRAQDRKRATEVDDREPTRRVAMNKRAMVPVLLLCGLVTGAAVAAPKVTKSNAPQNAQNSQQGQNGQNGQGQPSDEAKVKRGFEIAPVYLDLQGKNPALVGLGSYIVNAQAGCNDCHTWPNFAPGGDPYKGEPKMINATNYLAGGRPFGPFRSRNITPDPTSTLTHEEQYQEFVTTLRTGLDPDHMHPQFGPLLQVMPWSVYQDMTDRDLRAIFEYLSAIPHAEPFCKDANLTLPVCQP